MADETSPTAQSPRGADEPPTAPPPGPAGTVHRYRVRRSPNLWAFLVTGAFLGAIVGFTLDYLGPDGCSGGAPGRSGVGAVVERCTEPYAPGVSLAYFLVLGALAGIAVAATLVAVLDKALSRR